jgi:hypothetical protein
LPEGLLNAYAIKKPAFKLGIEDLIYVRDSPAFRLTQTPFVHGFEDTVFLGHAAPWKGVKGLEALASVNSKVAAGLRNAIKISQACKDEKGVVRVGDRYLPKKVICEMEKAGKPTPAPA